MRAGYDITPHGTDGIALGITGIFVLFVCVLVQLVKHGSSLVSLEEENHMLRDFDKWADEGNAIRRGLEFVWTTEDRGRVGVVSSDIAQGTVLLEVSKDAILSSNYAREKGVGALYRVPPADHELLLTLQLAYERGLGSASRWHTWIRTLPNNTKTGIDLLDTDIRCLMPQAVLLKAEMKTHLAKMQNVCNTRINNPTTCDSRRVKWAYNTVTTRAMQLARDGSLGIIPGVDMLNHGETDVALSRNHRSRSMFVVATRDILYGREVTMDYHSKWHFGDGQSERPYLLETFMRYGFADETFNRVACESSFACPVQAYVSRTGEATPSLVECAQRNNITMTTLIRTCLAAVPAPASLTCSQASDTVHRVNILERQTLFAAYSRYGGKPTDFVSKELLSRLPPDYS